MALEPWLARISQRRPLSDAEAEQVIAALMRGQTPPEAIAALLTAWQEKGYTADELVGAARAMRAAATPLAVPPGMLVDTCGTGGDGLGTFNISTVAALVVAGAGVRVAKHGNRGATSACGSADLLEALGVAIDPGPAGVARCLRTVGFGFLFAPRFHPAMRHVAPVRRSLGFRTIFNLLGPLTNPAGVACQVLGVAERPLTGLMGDVLPRLGSRHALVVHGEEGLDEASVTGPTRVMEVVEGRTVAYTITPEQLGVARGTLAQLRGGDPATCARIAQGVLDGQPGPYREAVVLNAACALYVGAAAADLTAAVAIARQTLDHGRARDLLARLITESARPA